MLVITLSPPLASLMGEVLEVPLELLVELSLSPIMALHEVGGIMGSSGSEHKRFVAKRGFNRMEAAAYIGISPTKFDQLVADGRMPRPKQIDGRKVWDVCELDPAFEELGSIDTSWDDVREDQEVSARRI